MLNAEKLARLCTCERFRGGVVTYDTCHRETFFKDNKQENNTGVEIVRSAREISLLAPPPQPNDVR